MPGIKANVISVDQKGQGQRGRKSAGVIPLLRRSVFIGVAKLCELMRFRGYRAAYLHFIKSDSGRWARINRDPADITSSACCRRMQMCRGAWSAAIATHGESRAVKFRLYSSIFLSYPFFQPAFFPIPSELQCLPFAYPSPLSLLSCNMETTLFTRGYVDPSYTRQIRTSATSHLYSHLSHLSPDLFSRIF